MDSPEEFRDGPIQYRGKKNHTIRAKVLVWLIVIGLPFFFVFRMSQEFAGGHYLKIVFAVATVFLGGAHAYYRKKHTRKA